MRQLVFVFVAFAFLTQCNSKQEVAQWRGPNRDGIYPEKNLLTHWPDGGPKLLWKYDELGLGYASAIVTSNRVYTIGAIDSISYIFSFNTNGDLLWKKELGREWTKSWPGIRSTPVIYGDLGYVLNGMGIIFCFNANDGNIVWTKDIASDFKMGTDGGYCENLIIDGEKLFFTTASHEANVVALNRKKGDLIWKTEGNNDSTSFCSPILIEVGGKKFFITQTNKSVLSYETETGKLAWKYALKGSPAPNTPLFRNGYLFAVDTWKSGGFMLKISDDGYNVKEVWRNPKLDPQQGDLVLLGDRMYSASEGGKKYACYDWNTGQEIYSDSTKAHIINIISADNLLYCYEFMGKFNLIKPTDKGFENVGSFKINGGTKFHCSHPVIKDRKLYIRHDNSLFVYDIANETN